MLNALTNKYHYLKALASAAFHKAQPNEYMMNRLHVDYIFHGHGIDKTNDMLPHSHLWDKLEVERLPMTNQHKKAYIRTMSLKHYIGFCKYGSNAIFHIHGAENENTDNCLARLEYNERKMHKTIAKWFLIIGSSMTITATYNLIRISQSF